ncbi:MAG: hypothetical protein L3K24_01975, partial [Gammaproteobacteria bacterium]|nr:hypothetical protein [Gammaproteobacteria bacterium]
KLWVFHVAHRVNPRSFMKKTEKKRFFAGFQWKACFIIAFFAPGMEWFFILNHEVRWFSGWH